MLSPDYPERFTEDEAAERIAAEFRAESVWFAEAARGTTDALAIRGLTLSSRHAATQAASIERDLRGLPPLADGREDFGDTEVHIRTDWDERPAILSRFLIISSQSNPLDMSTADITDAYAQIAASLFDTGDGTYG